jgi:hypothetical protein
MQSSTFGAVDFPSISSKTSEGQTSTQSPEPTHRSWLIFIVQSSETYSLTDILIKLLEFFLFLYFPLETKALFQKSKKFGEILEISRLI